MLKEGIPRWEINALQYLKISRLALIDAVTDNPTRRGNMENSFTGVSHIPTPSIAIVTEVL